jgi:hypothetical protein
MLILNSSSKSGARDSDLGTEGFDSRMGAALDRELVTVVWCTRVSEKFLQESKL